MKPTIRVQDRVTLDMTVDRAWELVTDPQVVVACVPGAEIESTEPDGTINGALTLSLGPTETRFQGTITPAFDETTRTGELKGQGSDGRGRTRAAITTGFELQAVDPDHTDLVLDSSIAVSGALAGFAATGGQAVARRLLQDFAENLARLADPTDVGPGTEPGPVAPTRLGLFGLLARTLRDVFRRLFAKLTRRRSE
ncbi:MAG TPA: SRPBCC domain-containing protein [Acidimicrobiia bacterium]|nr:SRPBCC domain-containing protein [Acidimicrobiia bacterium]